MKCLVSHLCGDHAITQNAKLGLHDRLIHTRISDIGTKHVYGCKFPISGFCFLSVKIKTFEDGLKMFKHYFKSYLGLSPCNANMKFQLPKSDFLLC